jgi:molybdenum cofactor cytidylyltransferase
MDFNNLDIVILAAGSSSRMGTSKQLLQVGGETLLERVVTCSLNSKISNVTVVLGSNSEIHSRVLKNKRVQVLVNPDWALGVGNTIKFSLKKLLENNINVQGVMFMVCDQPHISTVHLNNIIDRFIEESPVAVASQYKGTYGVPAIFDRIAFSNLLSISDQAGAKTVLQNWEGDLRLVSFNGGEIDLDTPEEYKQYLEQTKL